MVGGCDGSPAVLVRRRRKPAQISLLLETARLPPSISFLINSPEL
jgi:hypothetical protein